MARLHIEYLNTSFTGRAGQELLTAYYEALLESRGGSGFAALDGPQVMGYVCGVFAPEQIKRYLLTKKFIRLIFWGSIQLFTAPKMGYDFLSRFGKAGREADAGQSGYELRPIVVAARARGTGTAQALVNCLLRDAAERGFSEIYLDTEEDNQSARRFYKKVDFHLIRQHQRRDQVYLRYVRPVK